MITIESIEPLEIKIKYHDGVDPIEQFPQGDWIDLRTAEKIHMEKGDFRMINLGVSMKIPEGYEAHIVPRSSTFMHYGLIQTNHMGVIDNSYSGTNDIWHFPALATRMIDIPKNTRICQFRLVRIQEPVKFVVVDELDPEDRHGFGSTGRS